MQRCFLTPNIFISYTDLISVAVNVFCQYKYRKESCKIHDSVLLNMISRIHFNLQSLYLENILYINNVFIKIITNLYSRICFLKFNRIHLNEQNRLNWHHCLYYLSIILNLKFSSPPVSIPYTKSTYFQVMIRAFSCFYSIGKGEQKWNK